MNKMIGKLRSTRGETLAEILVSIVILGLSIGLMLTMIMTSTKITQNAREADTKLIGELNAAEQQNGDDLIKTADVVISGNGTTVTVSVDIFAEADNSNLVSYKIHTP